MGYREDLIIKCAKRIAEKLPKQSYYTLNGQYPKDIQVELDRIRKHCEELK